MELVKLSFNLLKLKTCTSTTARDWLREARVILPVALQVRRLIFNLKNIFD